SRRRADTDYAGCLAEAWLYRADDASGFLNSCMAPDTATRAGLAAIRDLLSLRVVDAKNRSFAWRMVRAMDANTRDTRGSEATSASIAGTIGEDCSTCGRIDCLQSRRIIVRH